MAVGVSGVQQESDGELEGGEELEPDGVRRVEDRRCEDRMEGKWLWFEVGDRV